MSLYLHMGQCKDLHETTSTLPQLHYAGLEMSQDAQNVWSYVHLAMQCNAWLAPNSIVDTKKMTLTCRNVKYISSFPGVTQTRDVA